MAALKIVTVSLITARRRANGLRKLNLRKWRVASSCGRTKDPRKQRALPECVWQIYEEQLIVLEEKIRLVIVVNGPILARGETFRARIRLENTLIFYLQGSLRFW
jgi:hypothetical protein